MKNKGSGIWLFVGIGLALAWAFSATAEKEKQDSSQLEPQSDGFQLLNQGQIRSAEHQPSRLPLHMQQPLEQSPAPWTNEPVRAHKPDLHLTESADQIEQVLPFVDLSEQPQQQFVRTDSAPNEMLAELNDNPQLDQIDQFEQFDQFEEPSVNMLDTPQFEEFGSDMTDTEMANVMGQEQPVDVQRDSHEAFAKATNAPNSNSKVVANPFFAESNSNTNENGFTDAVGQPMKIQNRFVTEPSQADLFAGQEPVEAIKIDATANRTQTEYASFEDLKSEQENWGKSISSVDNSSPYILNDITPMIAKGGQLKLAPETLQRCLNHIEQGRSLARRRAAYAAREEFFAALRVIAQSHDAQTRSKTYTSALSRAIVALDEADDFFDERAHSGMDINVLMVIDGHESKIIPKEIAENMSSLDAIRVYFDYARQNLHEGLGDGPEASEALYSLGKLFTLSAAHQLSGNPFDYAKSTVMHYAALDCYPKNHRSSNELGVLMARNGRLEKARDLFRDSLLVEQVPETWQNLAMVHEKMGQLSQGAAAQDNFRLAEMANQEYAVSLQNASPAPGRVQWVSPDAYNPENKISFSESRVAELPSAEAPSKKPFIKSLFR